MQDEREKAKELLKNGEYYGEALKWYNSRYITPRSQLAIFSLFMFAGVISLLVSLVTTIGVFPLSDKQSFVIARELKFNEGITVAQIGKTKDNPNSAFINLMLDKYVVAREEYIPSNVDYNFNFIIEQTSEDIFMDYLEIADKNQNPNHPVWQYGSQAVRNIQVTRISLAGVNNNSDFAQKEEGAVYNSTVNFVSSLLFIDNIQKQQKYEADISFKYTPIIIDQDTAEIKQLPKIVITDYKSRKL